MVVMRRNILPTAVIFFMAASGNVVALEKDELDSSTTKNHEEQRRAMLQALDDNNSASLFVSPQEQRSQYYIHEGLKSAIERSLRMASFDVDLLWDYLDDIIVGEEEGVDGDEDLEIAYPQFLEEVLTDMIREVEDSLQKITTNDDDAPPMEATITKQEKAQVGSSNTQSNENSSDADTTEGNSSSNNSIGPRGAIVRSFEKIHKDLHCDNYENITVDDPQGKWDNITKAYWNFFNLDPPTKLDPPVSDDDYDFYTTEGNVYFDFLHNSIVRVPYALPKQTTQRGMFAARDFERDELVYSYMANGLFFLELSTFEAFIRNSTLLPHDACLLAQWSFAQKLTRPGRYYICSSLDAGAYFNSGEGRRVNVYIEDARDLNYYASRNIAKGEEIIYSSSS